MSGVLLWAEFVLTIVGRLIVGTVLSSIAFGWFSLIFGQDEPMDSRAGKVVILVSQNWQAVVLLAAPLLLTGFLENIEEIPTPWGPLRRRRQLPVEQASLEPQNPERH